MTPFVVRLEGVADRFGAGDGLPECDLLGVAEHLVFGWSGLYGDDVVAVGADPDDGAGVDGWHRLLDAGRSR